MATIAPFDYTIQGVQTPFQAITQGLQVGAQMGELEARRQAAEAQRQLAETKALVEQQAMQRQQALQTAYSKLTDRVRSGTATFADFQEVTSLAPKDQAEMVFKAWDAQSAQTKENALNEYQQVASALGSKNPQIGIDLMRERADAYRNRGDEASARAYDVFIKISELDPVDGQAAILSAAARLPGGDKVVTGWKQTQEERRQKEFAPVELAIKRAQAGKEGFEAQKAGYEAGIKALELEYAPGKLADEVKKRAADLGLTRAQTEQASAAAQASQARSAADRAAAQQAAAGIIPSDKRPEAEAKLRKEYNDNTKGFTEVRSAFDRIQASQDTAVGDLSLIFGYMKMLDPGSVVREGEFATAQNAAGVPDRVLNLYNRVLSGERLNASQRSSFKAQAGQLYNAAQRQEQIVRDGITRIAGGMGLNTQNIFYEAAVPPGPPAVPVGQPGRPGGAPAGRPRNLTVDY